VDNVWNLLLPAFLWQAAQSTAHGRQSAGSELFMILESAGWKRPARRCGHCSPIRAQLALVDIRVAVLALAADIIELPSSRASRAGHANVHSAQRIRVWL